ncbi:MAG: hypothetical protein GF421_07300 [Candidatus Aminicenantes bacterium]|nr:hypothetical protein [Candidatus Aminicenantes bacterium]
MKIKEIFILFLIIIAGIIFYHAQTGNLDLYIELDDYFFDADVFTFEKTQHINPPFPYQMDISNHYGDIKVIRTEKDEITIYSEKKVRHRTPEEAKDIAENLKVFVNQDSEKIMVSAIKDTHRSTRLRTDLEVYIPKGFDLNIHNSYGMVDVQGAKNAEIINKNGAVHVSQITENLRALTTYKSIVVEKVDGECELEGLRSRINASDIKGKLIIKNKYGSIELQNISQNITVDGLHCRIRGENLSGLIEAENSYEPIELSSIQSATIKADNSPINIDNAQNDLNIDNKYSRIKLSRIDGNINIEGENNEVLGRDLFGDLIYVSSSYREINLNHFSAETQIHLAHGKVTLSPSFAQIKPISVKGTYAEIEFVVPPGIELPFQAQTKSGQIKWHLSEKGIKKISNGYTIIKAFLDNGEKPLVSLVTTYGNILVREDT